MDMKIKAEQEILRHGVGQQITCQMSGKILDVRTALMVDLTMASGTTATQVYDMTEVGDHVETKILPQLRRLADQGKLSFEVYDGRELFGRKRS